MEVEEAGELETAGKDVAEAEYHSHDFEWEELKEEVESGPAFSYHLSPFPEPAASTTSPPQLSSEAWRSFHRRHASGKFFKVASQPATQVPFFIPTLLLYSIRTSRNVGPWNLTYGKLTNESNKMFGWEMVARKRVQAAMCSADGT
jgi:hypothetical protein